MAAYFFDSSAIVKRHVQETGTAWVRRVTRHGRPDRIYLVRITAVEMASAVARRRRGGSLTAARVRSILTRFGSHLVLQRWIGAADFPSESAGTGLTSLKRKRRAFENAYHSMPVACASGLLQATSPASFAFSTAIDLAL